MSIRIIKTIRMAAALRLRFAPCRREENLRATVQNALYGKSRQRARRIVPPLLYFFIIAKMYQPWHSWYMNKAELIQALADARQIPLETSRKFIETLIDLTKQQLMDDGRVEIRGFGSFEMRKYKSFRGRNPKTGETVIAKPKRLPFFKCGKGLKDMVNESISL